MIIPQKLELLKKISSDGCFGEVLLYENNFLGRQEAVKIIPNTSKDEDEFIKELKNNLFESSVLEYLRKSDYIVNIYDAEIIENGFRIRMEYLEEGSVQNLLSNKMFLQTKQVIKIAECVLHALEHAHSKKIHHLDIKPGNILIKNRNIYKLSDFGLSNIAKEDGSSDFKKIYNSHCPPEKLSNIQEYANEQSDIYMLGITLYRLINGDSCFFQQLEILKTDGERKEAIISGSFPNRTEYLPHVNSKIKKIINKCINIDLGKRYQNVREIKNDFGKLKVNYNRINLTISDIYHHRECYIEDKIFLELIGESNSNGWQISLKKYTKNSKLKISKHCHKKLQEMDFYKKLSNIFEEYF